MIRRIRMMCCVGVLATSDQFHGLSAFARPRKSTLQNYGLFAFFNRITQTYLLPIYWQRNSHKNLPKSLKFNIPDTKEFKPAIIIYHTEMCDCTLSAFYSQ